MWWGIAVSGGVAFAETLELGEPMIWDAMGDADVSLAFEAPSAGLLSVAIRADADVALQAFDAEGLPLAGGWSDQDLALDLGAEQMSATVDQAGPVRVVVTPYDSVGQASLVATFAPWPAVENRDADSRPSGAAALKVGGSLDGALAPESGDRSDMFRVEGAGMVVVELRAAEADVALSGFVVADPAGQASMGRFLGTVMDAIAGEAGGDAAFEGDWNALGAEASPHYSDADLGGDLGHEAFVLVLTPGRPEFVQVESVDDAATAYTIWCWPVGGDAAAASPSEAPAGGADAVDGKETSGSTRPPY
ncbi:MAG: hypothetical protein AAGE65_05300 [Planctomycetota bacterium]